MSRRSFGLQVGQLRQWVPSVLRDMEEPLFLVIEVAKKGDKWEALVLEGETQEWYFASYVERCSTIVQ
jgi:hypothetical protein